MDIYESLPVIVSAQWKGIYGQPTQVFDLEKFKKVFDPAVGINLAKIKINSQMLDEMYDPFKVTKKKVDPEIELFLSIFTPEFK